MCITHQKLFPSYQVTNSPQNLRNCFDILVPVWTKLCSLACRVTMCHLLCLAGWLLRWSLGKTVATRAWSLHRLSKWIMYMKGRTSHRLHLKLCGDISLAQECNTVGTFPSDSCLPGIFLDLHIIINVIKRNW